MSGNSPAPARTNEGRRNAGYSQVYHGPPVRRKRQGGADEFLASRPRSTRGRGSRRDEPTRLLGDCRGHLPGYTPPDPIAGYIPDATSSRNGCFLIAEAETSDSLTEQHTHDQWRAFYREAAPVGGVFVAVVAARDRDAGTRLLRQIAGAAQNAVLWPF
ncbi:MAG: hypothetical protein IT208_06640 [Chthonomonadales bacterium]|nr:hypothetical protein [Chthonomonadales bacterium]